MGDVRVKAERRAITDIAGVDTLDIALIRRTSNPSIRPPHPPLCNWSINRIDVSVRMIAASCRAIRSCYLARKAVGHRGALLPPESLHPKAKL